jgi:ketosteroid isomerase-like protein
VSEENVEIIETAVAALNRGDWDAALRYAAPDIKFDFSRNFYEPGIYDAREMTRVFEGFSDLWESWRTEIDEFVHAGENVVVYRQTGYLRGRDGIEVTARTSVVWTFRDGAVTAIAQFNELEDALEAAGLSE